MLGRKLVWKIPNISRSFHLRDYTEGRNEGRVLSSNLIIGMQ